jgi:hypothetical protein
MIANAERPATIAMINAGQMSFRGITALPFVAA